MPLDPLPPGGHAPVNRAPARPLAMLGMRRRSWLPRVDRLVVNKWRPHPISVASARALGDLYGRGISGHAGTISTGSSRPRAGHTGDPAVGFAGYAQPPQLFTGWNPAYQTQTGTVLRNASDLPSTSQPGATGPLDAAMLQITAGTQ